MSEFVVGLTGGIGSGKTTVANMFNALGIELVDADIIAREVVEPSTPALTQIKEHFGDDFILVDGSLDRAKLRQKVFSSETEKQWLNNLLHPLIRSSILCKIKKCSGQYCILVAPLLFENKLTQYVNCSLVVDVEESLQIKRTVKRDNSNKATIEKIIASQISREKRLKQADHIIDNSSSDLASVTQQVELLHKTYLDRAKNSTN
jgi:dephospho-CoA kinase